MGLPLPLDPYLYQSYFSRAVGGDTALLHIDCGFGIWQLGSKWPGGPDAKYPQGRYRLNGIKSAQTAALSRVTELANAGEAPGSLLAKTSKHNKFFLVDLYLRQALPPSDPIHGLEVETEKKHWLSEKDLLLLIEQTEHNGSGSSTIRALTTEVLWSRRALQGFSKVVHINQALLDEGLAVPYSGGKR